jgi:hypothetical protein
MAFFACSSEVQEALMDTRWFDEHAASNASSSELRSLCAAADAGPLLRSPFLAVDGVACRRRLTLHHIDAESSCIHPSPDR